MKKNMFWPGHSTTTSNEVFCNYIFEAFKVHSQFVITFTDFSKPSIGLLPIIMCYYVSYKKQVLVNHLGHGFVFISMTENSIFLNYCLNETLCRMSIVNILTPPYTLHIKFFN